MQTLKGYRELFCRPRTSTREAKTTVPFEKRSQNKKRAEPALKVSSGRGGPSVREALPGHPRPAAHKDGPSRLSAMCQAGQSSPANRRGQEYTLGSAEAVKDAFFTGGKENIDSREGNQVSQAHGDGKGSRRWETRQIHPGRVCQAVRGEAASRGCPSGTCCRDGAASPQSL